MKKKGKQESRSGFTARLLQWNQEQNDRKMPWKGEKDPYKIWLSEIILQQTRVEQGLQYYQRFISSFPGIKQLAEAPDTTVFKLWEGLGYYSRCRNLLATARFIASEKKGKFPDTYEDIKALKGIGPYTAAAISSFAFDLPHAVVDGNVFRVLARYFGIHKPIDSTAGKKTFTALAEELLDRQQPGIYNQAIMDFGAVVCKPAAPRCPECPLKDQCHAFLHQEVFLLPVKEKKTRIRHRWFYYLIPEAGSRLPIRERTGKDIWQHLYEFPFIETDGPQEIPALLQAAEKDGWLPKSGYTLTAASPYYKQQLSHQHISARFIRLSLKKKPAIGEGVQWVTEKELQQYAFPRVINLYLEDRQQAQTSLFIS